MREFDPLHSYPKLDTPRYVGRGARTIQNRIVASYRGREFYDGDRNNGYGGYHYDGRWKAVAQDIVSSYGLDTSGTKVLQLGCDKGFLLFDLKTLYPRIEVSGVEISQYAVDNSKEEVRDRIQLGSFTALKFPDNFFDFIIAIGPVYSLTLGDAIRCLREIQRVGKGKSFITLGSYETEEEYWLFRDWTLLARIFREGHIASSVPQGGHWAEGISS